MTLDEQPGTDPGEVVPLAATRIAKDPATFAVAPNLADYDAARASFSWDDARSALSSLPGGQGLNIAHQAVDRHAAGPLADKDAVRFLAPDGSRTTFTYRQLAERTSRFANVLADLGVQAGQTVFTLLGPGPAVHTVAFGTLKHRAVYSPLFSSFGPDPVEERLRRGDGVVLVTTSDHYRKKLADRRDRLPLLAHVLVIDAPTHADAPDGTRSLDALLDAASDHYEIGPTRPEDPALIHFTSGTTGTPKGAVHVHGAVVAHHVTGAFALDLHESDVFWCTADPGWVTGTSYGLIAPLSHGATVIVDQGGFEIGRWLGNLREHAVTVWYTAPTAIRMLTRAEDQFADGPALPALRFIASVGEPLHAEEVMWADRVLGLPIHDNWWQTETGGIMVANFAATEVRPGSMGRPLPGIEAAVVRHDEDEDVAVGADGQPLPVPDGEVGELALRVGWPSMFVGYLHDDERYRRCFLGDWYLSGDLVRRDADGWFWFVGRGDDVIKSAGHLVGPTEVERTLRRHLAVADVGMVGIPDPVAGNRIKAFVVAAPGHVADQTLRRELLGFARSQLGAAVAPKSIEFRDSLPHTDSGKIIRRLLRDEAIAAESDTADAATSSTATAPSHETPGAPT